jgi:hypothetical protein
MMEEHTQRKVLYTIFEGKFKKDNKRMIMSSSMVTGYTKMETSL